YLFNLLQMVRLLHLELLRERYVPSRNRRLNYVLGSQKGVINMLTSILGAQQSWHFANGWVFEPAIEMGTPSTGTSANRSPFKRAEFGSLIRMAVSALFIAAAIAAASPVFAGTERGSQNMADTSDAALAASLPGDFRNGYAEVNG